MTYKNLLYKTNLKKMNDIILTECAFDIEDECQAVKAQDKIKTEALD